jgi:hypothetical protein
MSSIITDLINGNGDLVFIRELLIGYLRLLGTDETKLKKLQKIIDEAEEKSKVYTSNRE